MITICPFAYLLGNFVGSFVGSFAYIAVDKAFISFAVYSGWTFFGVVKQNYILPDNVIEELGIDLFDYEKMFLMNTSLINLILKNYLSMNISLILFLLSDVV